MKNKSLLLIAPLLMTFMGSTAYSQAPAMGSCVEFAIFTSNGAVMNTGISQITGNVGTNSGSSTGFGNVNGGMHDNDVNSAQAAADLLIAYNQLNSTIPQFFLSPLLGNGDTLNAGTYETAGATTLNGNLYLDAQFNPSAVFIIRVQGPLSTGAGSRVKLIHGALACNVYWKIEGLVSMASGTIMRGTVIANNAAINMSTNDTLEGRVLSTAGAVTISGTMLYTPIGCGSPALTGPAFPPLGHTECYAIFSGNGAVTNAGTTFVTGDVGTNVGLTTGFQAINVNGTIHPIPDVSTADCATDLQIVYNYLNALPYDIELLYPAQFGNNLVLTPHTYLLNAATAFTDTLYLNALGDTNAVFVIKIQGALTTSSYCKVLLTNGAKSKNIFWMIEGAVNINDYSSFKGTIVCNNGAIDLTSGVNLQGRALTTSGNLTTASISSIMPQGCVMSTVNPLESGEETGISVYPNPFNTRTTLTIGTVLPDNSYSLHVITLQGVELFVINLNNQKTTIPIELPTAGTYFYCVYDNDCTLIQSGTLISTE